jgi:hypothetical protein
MTKKELFIVAYNNLPEGTTRKQALVALQKACGLSAPGCSTYYSNVKSGRWATDDKEVEKQIK